MKRILFLVIPTVFLYACTGNSESAVQTNVDTTPVITFDTSSANAFIKTFSENRKSSYPTDFEIAGNCILENGFFRIINFIETIGNYSYEYCLVMNPLEKVMLENPDKDTYMEVQQIITDNNFKMSLYQGNLSPIYYDLKGDGSEDYQLSLDESYHTDFQITQTIMLYDGINRLEKTEIVASSAFAAGVSDEEFSGVKESFQFKKHGKNLPQIIVTHNEHNFKPDESYQTGIGNFEYTLTWQWSETGTWGEPEWVTSFKGNYKNCQRAINEFSKPRFLLNDQYEGYAILENCQNGGPDYFVLNPFSDDFGSNYYIIGDNYDDVGSDVLIAAYELENNYLLLFSRYEKMESNVKGYRHIGFDISLQYISYNNGSDLETHWGSMSNGLYTNLMDKYAFVSCD